MRSQIDATCWNGHVLCLLQLRVSAGVGHAQHWVAEQFAAEGRMDLAIHYFQLAASQQVADSLMELAHLAKEGWHSTHSVRR